jgi:hypothetical protein
MAVVLDFISLSYILRCANVHAIAYVNRGRYSLITLTHISCSSGFGNADVVILYRSPSCQVPECEGGVNSSCINLLLSSQRRCATAFPSDLCHRNVYYYTTLSYRNF